MTDKQDAYADFDASGEPEGGTGAALAQSAADWTQEDLVAEIRESFALIEPYGPEAAAWFYEHFFAANPRYRKYFSSDPAVQQRRLFQSVQRVVADLDRLDEFLPYLRRLALRHRKFALRSAHYQAFGASLLATVAQYCGPQWTERTNAAWEAGYGLVATVMLEAGAEEDAVAPPYWEAEVVGHEVLGGAIAKITAKVLEDSRLPGGYSFRAGQFAAVETAAAPRVWRDFSFANAPGNGEIEFHVQSVRPGGVSEVLVQRTSVGDRLRVAQAEGELAFPEPERAGRLLAIAHDTAAAPVYALVAAAVAERDARPLTVLLLSDQGPHYLADAFESLVEAHADLTVEEVDNTSVAAVRAHSVARGPGGAIGAVLVGPSVMVDECRKSLLAAGVDAADVSSDQFD
ncbi:MAG: globin domain-containing protein [Actinocrinis sp.]